MEIYLSYAREDVQYGERLKRGLAPMAKDFGYTIWSKQNITPGALWQQEMGQHLRDARLFIPLLSADFLADDRCTAETKGALQMEQRGSLKVVPVLLRVCMWEYSDLSSYPVLPSNGRAIANYTRQDSAWVAVQEAIIKIIKGMQIA